MSSSRASKFNYIWNETYKVNIYWVICAPDKFRRLYKSEFKEEFSGELKGGKQCVATKKGKEIVVVWINSECDILSVVVHEMFHAVIYIMRSRAVYLDNESCEEAYAYLLESVLKNVFNKLRRRINSNG